MLCHNKVIFKLHVKVNFVVRTGFSQTAKKVIGMTSDNTKDERLFDTIIVGGSYSGLAAGMALGRSLRRVLIIDSGKPCNRQTPHSHNFLIQDGKAPGEIAMLAKQQVAKYDTVSFFDGLATKGAKTGNRFEIQVSSGETFSADKLIFATGVRDILPDIDGFAACWGISVLHCPYCHGYEVRHQKTGIFGNGDFAFEFAKLISNWTNDLTLFTNGPSMFTPGQSAALEKHTIGTAEKEIERIEHTGGYIDNIVFKDGTKGQVKALYAPRPFEQHCDIPIAMGCKLTEDGYIYIDPFYQTTVPGVFACGDNVTRMRSVANAVGMGTATGAVVNREMVNERFG